MAVYKRGKIWWYKFNWNGEPIRESTKQSNKRTAEQMEATHKTSLAKGEVGLRDRKPAPTLKDFADQDFLPFVRSMSAGKPRTVTFYETTVGNLKGFGKLASLRLDAITPEILADFAAYRREDGMQISTINRDLATVRRMFHLAQEWGRVTTVLPRVRMLPGESHRERVLTDEAEQKYLQAAVGLGRELDDSYRRALEVSARRSAVNNPNGLMHIFYATLRPFCLIGSEAGGMPPSVVGEHPRWRERDL